MNRRQVGAWALYDFANSVFPAVITAVVFVIYFTTTVVGNEAREGDKWWGFAVSLSALIVALSAPLLGAIADRAGVRKKFMAFYVAMCVSAVAMFTTLGPGTIVAGVILFVIANVGFESSLVFYNAYLPDIVPAEKQGRVSGLGFGVGYVGSAIGLLLALPFARTNIDIVWLMVASFFVLFSIPAFRYLPPDEPGEMKVSQAALWGITSFRTVWGEVLAQKELRRFLLAFFFYIDGVLTAIVMTATIADKTFGFTGDELIYLFLAVQVSALAGAFALAKPTDTIGPKKVLSGVLLLWAVIVVSIYFVETKLAFAGLILIGGFGLGSVQAASRAFMASLIPDGRESEMFGFYALCGKSSSVIGPLIFGTISGVTGGNQKFAVMALSVLFVTGWLLLQRVTDPKASAIRSSA
ncbi:MAG: MFS transporter [Gemmatimonadales bacterium]|nr:MAG: MFS transporter [Gemmatimonadales bacterium]